MPIGFAWRRLTIRAPDNDDYACLKALEQTQIEQDLEGEREQIHQFYLTKNYQGEDLETMVALITAKKDMYIDVMMAQEYGLQAVQRSPIRTAFTILVGLFGLRRAIHCCHMPLAFTHLPSPQRSPPGFLPLAL